MSYTIQAIIGTKGDMKALADIGACVIQMPQDFALVPFKKSFLEANGVEWLAVLEGDDSQIGHLLGFLRQHLNSGKAAYIEAEYFGGDGTQASLLLEEGRSISDPLIGRNAINQALSGIGVLKGGSHDEFDALCLGQFRNTEAWCNTSA